MGTPASCAHLRRYFISRSFSVQPPQCTINFGDYESRMYFDRVLRQSGLFDRLEAMGIEEGDTVSIYDLDFEFRF